VTQAESKTTNRYPECECANKQHTCTEWWARPPFDLQPVNACGCSKHACSQDTFLERFKFISGDWVLQAVHAKVSWRGRIGVQPGGYGIKVPTATPRLGTLASHIDSKQFYNYVMYETGMHKLLLNLAAQLGASNHSLSQGTPAAHTPPRPALQSGSLRYSPQGSQGSESSVIV
jgi:hypothetical protein